MNIGVPEPYRGVLRFLWVNDVNSNTLQNIVKRFTRVIFGSISFLLNATISKHLSLCHDIDAAFVKHLSQELYVDDLVSGGNTSVKHLSQELYVDDLVIGGNTSVNIYHKNYMWMTL